MANLKNLPWLRSNSVQQIFSILEEIGAETRVVGGAVRNSILKLDVNEVDFATTAVPDEVITIFTRKGIKTIPTGMPYGTVTIVIDSEKYEITTLREDIQTDGRHAVVKFGKDWSKDAQRRDFTMNALYLDRNGKLFDYVNGYRDCLAKRVKFIGSADERIKEDYLRILRYFRFLAMFGAGDYDKTTMSAILRNRQGLNQLSPERISMELIRIFPAPNATKIFEKIVETGLFEILTGGVARFPHFQRFIELSIKYNLSISPAIMVYVLAVFVTEDINRLLEKIFFLFSERKRLLRVHEFVNIRCLEKTDQGLTKLLYKYGRQIAIEGVLIKFARGELSVKESELEFILLKLNELEIPTFEITGDDLISMGFKPGIQMGELLRNCESKWINSGFKLSKNELLQQI